MSVERIGVDEAGKGDYFGCLVVAAVYVDDESEKKLAALRARDSKTLSDSTAKKMAQQIRKICPNNVVRISPEKYNLLYKNFKSLNKLLAWAHAQAIENILKQVKCTTVIIDKFGDEKLVSGALLKKGIKVNLIQRHRAESDIAVAAASVLARAEFLRTLRQLSLLVGYQLPKGAAHVEEAAREMIKRHGPEILDKVAKVHFRTTKKINRAVQ